LDLAHQFRVVGMGFDELGQLSQIGFFDRGGGFAAELPDT
jgi:hypothetical protein